MATETIIVPDIGDAANVDVVEINVKVGDTVAVDTPLITLEGDKATMEVPSPKAGVVESIAIKVGDKVSAGSMILTLSSADSADKANATKSAKSEAVSAAPVAAQVEKSPAAVNADTASASSTASKSVADNDVYAGPAVRRIARELDIDLHLVRGSGEKNRITVDDIKRHLRGSGSAGAGFALPEAPAVDFSRFGNIEFKPLSKINKLSGANLHRNWVTIPHVTQFDEADITDLENFRASQKDAAEKAGFKLTPLVFIMKAVVQALRQFPTFNSSLDSSGENLILKKYFHLGVAVDTPNGLVVPVIRDVDKKTASEVAQELGAISKKAREKGLGMADMQGSCFSISSLGGIGGTAFTPIINAPDVAILGVSKAQWKPQYIDNAFQPRLMLPLSLSYDHRVIDGAEAARFITFLTSRLADIRTLIL